MISPCPCFPTHIHTSPLEMMQRGSGKCTRSGFVSQLRNPEYSWPESFMMSWKQTWLLFAPERDIIFFLLDSIQICCFLLRHCLYLSRLFTLQTSLKGEIIHRKSSLCLWSQDTEMGETHGECLPKGRSRDSILSSEGGLMMKIFLAFFKDASQSTAVVWSPWLWT